MRRDVFQAIADPTRREIIHMIAIKPLNVNSVSENFNVSRTAFAAFTDPEHLMRCWGPKAFKMVYCKLDLRPGGMFHYCAQSPERSVLWGRFVYREIIPTQRIIFVNSFSDEYGNPRPHTLSRVAA